MPELSVELVLAVPPARVWGVLTDFAKYREWHPYQTIEGVAQPLAVVTIFSRTPGANSHVAKERAIVWKAERQKQLILVGGKLAERYFHLQPHAQGTLLRHGYKVSGLWVNRLIPPSFRMERLQPLYEIFNKALESRVLSQNSMVAGS